MSLPSVPSIVRSNSHRYALGSFLAFTIVAIAGFAIFVHSSWGLALLGQHAILATIFAHSFTFFAQTNIVLSILVLAWFLTVRVGLRWLAVFSIAVVVSFGAEFLGTTTGIPFGAYAYTSLLGPKILDHVPYLIPISWFTCALPAYVLAARCLPAESRLRRVMLATFLIVLWDVSLDPAMSYVTSYWVWDNPGAYYGMPLVNFLGWALTGFAITSLFELTDIRSWASRISGRWMLAYYLILLALPVGMAAAAGFWIPGVLTAVGLAIFAGIAKLSAYMRPRSMPFQYMSGSA